MWHFAWSLGLELVLASGIISVMWLEANYAFRERDDDQTREKFERARRHQQEAESTSS
jgi:cyd operon protein YbgT